MDYVKLFQNHQDVINRLNDAVNSAKAGIDVLGVLALQSATTSHYTVSELSTRSVDGEAILPKSVYRHYKTGHAYEVLLLSTDEASLRTLVHYTRYGAEHDGKVWTRTQENFIGLVYPKNPLVRVWKWWQRQLGLAAGELPLRFTLEPQLGDFLIVKYVKPKA